MRNIQSQSGPSPLTAAEFINRFDIARVIAIIATAIPVISLFGTAALWVRYGIDLPFIDDWRDFAHGTAGSLALPDLFQPANDTIYATGKLLDALAVRLLAYNGIVYQLLSLIICLGALLFFQHRLLFRSMTTAAASLGMLTSILMMQPYSYWGLQNLAYHQVLPLTALFAGLALTVTSQLSNATLTALVGVISILGGLAYISGAFVALSSAGVLYLLSLRGTPETARRLRHGAYGFAIGAICTLPPQLWVILSLQGGGIHDKGIPWTFPWQTEFWVFLFGLIGRSIGAQAFLPGTAIALTSLLTASFMITAFVCLYKLRKAQIPLNEIRFPVVYLTLFCSIGLYSILIATSRSAHGATPDAAMYDWFLRSGGRFHYFWITTLIPWAASAVYYITFDRINNILKTITLIIISTAFLYYSYLAGMFDYSSFYQTWAARRQLDMNCIQEKILLGDPIVCGGMWQRDLTKAVSTARKLGTNFSRNLLFRDELRFEFRKILGSPHNIHLPSPISFYDAKVEYESSQIKITSNGTDPQINLRFQDGDTSQLRKCNVLNVTGSITANNSDMLQLFVSTPEIPYYSEIQSSAQRYEGNNAPQRFDLTIGSQSGFLSDVRIDPGAANQHYRITDLSFTCQ